MIIAFGYKARSGKDTAANYLVNQHGFKPIAFAGQLKKTVQAAYGLSDAQLYGDEKLTVDPFWNKTPVELLQFIGTDVFRDKVDPSHWIKNTMRIIDLNPSENYIVTDMRFSNEAEAIRSRGGYLIRIDRDADLRGNIGRSRVHQSEVDLDFFTDWDVILDNNGSLQTLFEGVETVLREIGEGRISKEQASEVAA